MAQRQAARLTARQLADVIAGRLEWLDVYAPEAGAEARRVLNLGCPLAEMIRAGMVARATPEGRDHLESTARELASICDVIAERPELAVMTRHENWRGESVLSWVPLWDLAQERSRAA